MLPKETLELFFNTVKRSSKAEVVAVPGKDDEVFLCQGDQRLAIDIPPPRRQHVVERLDDLCEIASREQNDKITPSLWHAHSGLVLLLDHDDRRDVVSMPLSVTVCFAKLEWLHKERPWLLQTELIRLLRVELSAAVPPELLKTVRTIKFHQGSDVESDVQVASERLGRSIEAAVTGAGDLPDDVVCRGHVYRDVDGEQFAVRLALEVDFKSQKFRLLPVGDAVPDAINAAQNDIRGQLNAALGDGTSVLVYQGTP